MRTFLLAGFAALCMAAAGMSSTNLGYGNADVLHTSVVASLDDISGHQGSG